MSIFDKPQIPHLLEDFWTRLKQKLTWKATQPATAVQFLGQPQPSNSCVILQPWNLNRYFKASSVFNKVWLTQFTVNWYGLHFHISVDISSCIWNKISLYSAHVSLQTKLSDNMKCGISQGQVNYCYSQILLKHIIPFNISMFQNLCTIKSLYAGWD